VVWRTPLLHAKLSYQHTEHLQNLRNRFAPDMFYRAVQYLYTKETRSSYSIERESPSSERVSRFVNLLQQAGKAPLAQLLTEENLVLLQQEILEPRFAAMAFRDFQNYVGQSLPNFQEMVHYLCPPPAMLPSLMKGLQNMLRKTTAMHPVARAAMASFGLVFAHPFEDGNGRLHRFLIHDLLMRGGLVPAGMIVPVSAHMLKHLAEYDKVLEAYSRPLMQRVQYRKKPDGDLEILNPADIEGYYRFPDLTQQATYLAQVVEKTIEEDMVQELEFLQRYDALKLDIQAIADMPDKKIDMLIALLHQNHGKLAKRKRLLFEVLTDVEIAAIEGLYDEVFAAPRETG
jgi:Fic/DOC family